MLNEKERRKVLSCLSYFCYLGLLPLRVDVDSWQILPGLTSAWKKLASALYFATFVAHSGYQNLSLMYALMFRQDTPLHHMIIHMTLAVGSAMVAFWYYVIYILYPEISAALTRMTLTGRVVGGDSVFSAYFSFRTAGVNCGSRL